MVGSKSLYYHLKSFIAGRLSSILVNLRYLILGLLKCRENSEEVCDAFGRDFKNVPLYIMRKVSLERCFVLCDCALTSKISKMAFGSFCDGALHLYLDGKRNYSCFFFVFFKASMSKFVKVQFCMLHVRFRIVIERLIS